MEMASHKHVTKEILSEYLHYEFCQAERKYILRIFQDSGQVEIKNSAGQFKLYN